MTTMQLLAALRTLLKNKGRGARLTGLGPDWIFTGELLQRLAYAVWPVRRDGRLEPRYPHLGFHGDRFKQCDVNGNSAGRSRGFWGQQHTYRVDRRARPQEHSARCVRIKPERFDQV